ncbi:TetR/AcrR family transcriptional regulator [Streptomyces purpurogeneiscleroticus]|uniref:TetR/AcrR family transcriptional regulator n=1 Tax=Streptomyces purpurogeneiscleroticus TaxID=68259 RepID=UPI001CBE3E3E|nr:TetR/AcrR family transcriptional regulator [Streptomyces purpurogeneiscleroticus]MBZ4018283.1 TetR family transcriptional regulator [Streptomyces purpurogeneiscleroticus]
MPETGSAALRADARRNRALVLQAARSAFEERGLTVPLGEIARRAGVGAGTVYRHFPSKDALFRATVADRLRLFTDTARDLADVPDPGEVFFRFISSVVRLVAQNKAMCAALEGTAVVDVRPVMPGLEEEFWSALDVLLIRAQRAGAVRKDVSIADVRVLLTGCMAMEVRRSTASGGPETGPGDEPAGESAGDVDSPADMRVADGVSGRMTALMCDALRAGRDVTKLPFEAAENNETVCEECGGPVQMAHTGRPARYCGGACRQKAHRTRSRSRSEGAAAPEAAPADESTEVTAGA